MKHATKAAHPPLMPVKSSMVSAVGYDPATSSLHVTFPKGGHYIYEGVTPEQHAALVGAESVGKHFAANVRSKFKHRMLNAEAGR